MAEIEYNDFSAPRETRSPELTTVELVEMSGREIGRYTFQPGWRWSECIKPAAGTESCQVDHFGYMANGSMHIVNDDGSTADLTKGSIYHIPPGHDGWVTGDEPAVLIEFSSGSEFASS